jgi:DNA adenine methylase
LGFAFFFLNRTNRSGIISGGVIGGLEQLGEWKIDARFNRKELIRRIELIAEYRDRISLYNLDALDLIKEVVPSLPNKTLVYLDPPYYVKGQRLYDNHYKHDDHAEIAKVVQKYIKQPWIVSYDNCENISELYCRRRQHIYTLNYSASRATVGSEIMIYGDTVEIPEVESAVFRIAS